MGHRFDVGDVIDVLEESVVMKRPVVVELRGGHTFEDRVQEIVKWRGEDHVVFRDHALTPLTSISTATRAQVIEPTYAGRRL
jgi:hypothetical protein